MLVRPRLLERFVVVATIAACGPSSEPMPLPPAAIALPAPRAAEVAPVPPPPSAPTSVPAAPAPPRWPGAQANTDPADDFVVGPPDLVPDCSGALERAGVTFRPAQLAVRTTKSGMVCGAPEVVAYVRGPGNIAYGAPLILTCRMALALATFERLVQEVAGTVYSSKVTRIDQMGTYSCREVAAFRGLVSEHSYANALDVQRFVLANGKSVEVLRDFEQADATHTPAGQFLRVVSRRAYDEDVFSVVLTPFFNADHRNHFHLDIARYRRDGTRP